MSQHYSDPTKANDKWALPDVEVFYAAEGEMWNEEQLSIPEDKRDAEPSPAGWYYWYCLPGCMPDSDPFGPYATEVEAVAAMRDEADNG